MDYAYTCICCSYVSQPTDYASHRFRVYNVFSGLKWTSCIYCLGAGPFEDTKGPTFFKFARMSGNAIYDE